MDNIVEKMKNWDTWDALVKDLEPYFVEVLERMKAFDQAIVKDFYLLELLIIPVVKVKFAKTVNELRDRINERLTAYSDVVIDILKLHRSSEKLNDVLEAHPRLMDCEKKGIREDWKKQHAIETTGDENLMVEEELVEYFKAKCDELCNIQAEIDETNLQKLDVIQFRRWIHRMGNWLKGHSKFSLVSSDIHDEHKKWVRGMRAEYNSCSSSRAIFPVLAPSDLHDEGMRAEDNSCSSTQEPAPSDLHDEGMRVEDNSCSSTQAEKWHASCEDNICRQKKPKLDEC